jgi:hypothetical protein
LLSSDAACAAYGAGQCISLRMMLDPPEGQTGDVIERINAVLPTGFEFFGYTRVTVWLLCTSRESS